MLSKTDTDHSGKVVLVEDSRSGLEQWGTIYNYSHTLSE